MKRVDKGVVYVLVQFLIFALYLIDFQEITFKQLNFIKGFSIGVFSVSILLVIIALIQLNTKISPLPKPRADSKLLTTGAFSFTRHPIYTGIIFSTFFYGLSVGSGWKILLSVLFYVLFYFKSSYEEKLMLRKFPEYRDYQSHTGQLFPFVGIK